MEHLHARRSAAARSARLPKSGAAADDRSGLTIFAWGALAALALWWLYLRPASTQRKVARLEGKLNTLRPNRRPGPRPGSRPATPPTAARVQAAAPSATLTPAVPPEPDDDLTRILGIGPARAARLREAGITHFAALAVADAEQLRDLLAGVPVGAADLNSWPEQASLAARGDWDGLAALQDRLRAERT